MFPTVAAVSLVGGLALTIYMFFVWMSDPRKYDGKRFSLDLHVLFIIYQIFKLIQEVAAKPHEFSDRPRLTP